MSTTMIAPPAERLFTAEEFQAQPDDGRRTELVRGRVVEMPPTNFLHGVVCYNAALILGSFVKARDLGWVTCNDSGVITRRDPDSVRAPDVAYFSYQRIPKDSPPKGYPAVAPELVIEVKSPSDRWKEISAKAGEFLAAGTVAVCVLDPETRTVGVYTADEFPLRKTADEELTLPGVFPDFRVPVRQFFE